MRIGLNGLFIGKQRTGVHQYVHRLARALRQADTENEYLLYLGKQVDPAPYEGPRWRVHSIPFNTVKSRYRVLYEELRLPRRALLDQIDVFHAPTYTLPRLLRKPSVLTVHDLITFTHPKLCRSKASVRRVRRSLPRSAARAMRVIVPTEHVRRELLKETQARPERVTVVPHGVGEEFKRLRADEVARVRGANHWPQHYMLYAGALEPKKNLGFIIRGFYAAIMNERLPHCLVLAGPPGWDYRRDIEEATRLGIGGRVMLTGFVPPERLAYLYAAADVLLFPSIVEGFGLPILEAMACGTPVVTSTHPACVEVAGGAALTVDPGKLTEFRIAIENVLRNKDVRRDLRRQGLLRAGAFTWRRTAEQTLEIYRQARTQWEAIGALPSGLEPK